MLARENENFRAPGENRTRDPPNTTSYVLTTEPPVWIFVQNYASLRRCCLRVWMAWGVLNAGKWHSESTNFQFFFGGGGAHPQTPLVKLVQITHVKSWIHPCKFWEKYSLPRAIIGLLRLLTSHNIHFWSSIENFPLPVIHRVLKFLYLSFAQGIWWKLRNISQWRIILGCSKWTDCKL